jgi:P-type conjugative transfer protein TrbJ
MSKRKFVAAVLAAFVVQTNALASGLIAGATEPTQILNNLQLLANGYEEAETAATVVAQYATQLEQYQTELANLKSLASLPAGLVADAQQALSGLNNYRAAIQQLMGSLGQQQSAMEQRLTEARLSGRDWNSYVNAVAADAASKDQKAIDRLQYEESVLQQVQSDYSFARNLQSQIPSTVGQHQALQLMNSQMNRVVTQNAKLLEVISSTLSQQTDKDANEAESATRSLAQQDLLRQRQEAIESRQRSFGGYQ